MRNSNKLLALALAAVLAFGSTTAAFAAEADEVDAGEATPISDTDTSKTPADSEDEDKKDDADSADSEDKKDDTDSADGEDKKDDADSTDGEDKKDEDAPATDAAPAMNYSDVTEKNWYHGAVSFVTEKKLMDGLTATTFGPSEDMTRQMLAVALYRLAGSPEVTAENPFTDVADSASYKDAVVWAYSVGVVNGVTETTFSPDSSIQRQAIATMLARYLKVDTSADGDVSAFKDADAIQSFAKGAMAWAAENELLQGNPDGTVNPRGNASRSAVATILQRFAPMAEGKAPAADNDAAPADDTDKAEDTTPADDTNKDENTTPADDTSKDEGTTPADDTSKDEDTTPADDTSKDDTTDKE